MARGAIAELGATDGEGAVGASPAASAVVDAAASTTAAAAAAIQARGYAFGALGVLIFALTMPMTRLAVGDASAPQLPPAFVTAGRAAVAGLMSLAWLLLARARRPARGDWPLLALSAFGTVLAFPLGLAMALRDVPSMHASVVTGVIPLATATVAALVLRQRPSLAFWACALAGFALVIAFAVIAGGGHLVAADGWLAFAVAGTGIGYVAGAQVSLRMPPAQTICWVLVISLPLTLPAMWWSWPAQTAGVSAGAWAGFAYVSLFSMWLGFFAWYRGLALGGVMRVSQVQLAQPFLALLAAVPLLGEQLEPLTLGFALAVLVVVLIGRRLPPAALGVKAANGEKR
jgi:drug/metabolite transporter (DMT)-like permease